MQNPRLRYGPDDYESQETESISNPPWPSDTPSPQNIGLSWSSSGERDTPSTPAHRIFLPFGKQTYPRPKRIDRFYTWDDHLIVIFASPAARRAVLAAYAWWMRHKLLDAHEENEEPVQSAVLPPVSAQELTLGGVPVGTDERAALDWAKQVGWRPEYRIRPYRGRRKKNDDGEGWYKTEIETRQRIRDRKRELEEGRWEEKGKRRGRKIEEGQDVESEGQP
ncbi:unnamed protein product [Rhizoctonia solani]|uniref:Uncharacterized protein n=1 Tax=Rhizoctonia solani TaxID=456999 RepID=A0A8H3A5P1_9AGAM|nr:unnamed protein product [Rhizoctonia solani]